MPEIVDEVLASKPPCSILAFPKTDATDAVVARLLVDAARRAACARQQPLAGYLAALEPGTTPDPAVAASLRDGLRRASPPPRATSCSIRALAVVLAEGVRALDPVRLITLLRDGADACRPLLAKPDGTDAVAAQFALRTFVAAACELKTPAAPLASAIAADDPLGGGGAGGAASTDDRAEQAIRAGMADRGGRAPAGRRLTGTGADALRALAKVVPADRLLLAAQGSDDACRPLAWQPTNSASRSWPRSWCCTA